MSPRERVVLRAAIDDVAQALQVAIGLATGLRRTSQNTADETIALEAAIGRAVTALRRLQPREGRPTMIPADFESEAVVEELSTSLHDAIVLAGRLATGLRADAHDADVLYQALARATEALRRLRPTGAMR